MLESPVPGLVWVVELCLAEEQSTVLYRRSAKVLDDARPTRQMWLSLWGLSFVQGQSSQRAGNRERCSRGWEKYLNIRLSAEKLRPCDGCDVPDDDRKVFCFNCGVRRALARFARADMRLVAPGKPHQPGGASLAPTR